MAEIWLVEDEFNINELMRKNLTLIGHTCKSFFDGLTALEALDKDIPDLIILDVMLPFMNGFELIKRINNVPVIFVTAKNTLKDKINGLDLGAEDYIVKPFEIEELLARVRVVLKRTKKEETYFQFDSVKIDFVGRKVFLNNIETELTPKEFTLLEVLIRNRNIALSRERLLELVWSYDYDGDTRTVDVHIQKLRSKLEIKERIKTVNKFGYRFEI